MTLKNVSRSVENNPLCPLIVFLQRDNKLGSGALPSTCLERGRKQSAVSQRARQTRQRVDTNNCSTHLLAREASTRAISRFIIHQRWPFSFHPALLHSVTCNVENVPFSMSHSSPTLLCRPSKAREKHKAMSCVTHSNIKLPAK